MRLERCMSWRITDDILRTFSHDSRSSPGLIRSYIAFSFLSYRKGDSCKKGGEAKHNILEAVVSKRFIESSEHTIEIGLRILHQIILVLHDKCTIHRIRYRLILLCSGNSGNPIISRLVIFKTKCVVLIEILSGFDQQTTLWPFKPSYTSLLLSVNSVLIRSVIFSRGILPFTCSPWLLLQFA